MPYKRGGSTLRKSHKSRTKKRVRFNLSKNKTRIIGGRRRRSPSRRNRRSRRRRHHRGGNLVPQFISNGIRSGETTIVNTLNTLKGRPLSPSPYPTQDQPIDQNVTVI